VRLLPNAEFKAYAGRVREVFEGWKTANIGRMKSFGKGGHPKALIHELSEDLLTRFGAAPLIDKYDVYQHLMTYWAEAMQDDAYQLAFDGWQATEDLIPAPLIIGRYFPKEQAEIEVLEAEREAAQREKDEMDEEHGGEDGLLAEAKTDKGKLTAASVKARLKDIKGDPKAGEERQALDDCLVQIEKEAALKKKVKDAAKALERKVAKKYAALTEAEIKALIVEDKWLGALEAAVNGELYRVSRALTGRIKLLTERYARPLPRLTADVAALSTKVDAHLNRMGFAWN
jgi:type I restriction enzyme M protein